METKVRRVGKVLVVVGSYICVGCLGGYLERFFRFKAREEDYRRRVEELGKHELDQKKAVCEVNKLMHEYQFRNRNLRDFAHATFGGAYDKYVTDQLEKEFLVWNKEQNEKIKQHLKEEN